MGVGFNRRNTIVEIFLGSEEAIKKHKKDKWYSASDDEKRDKNIVMPISRFGCDDLFEHRYIYADEEGIIRPSDKGLTTVDTEQVIQSIVGRKCDYWNNDTAEYFKWHKKVIAEH